VRLLISGMYDANSPITWGTVKPLLEMARKYDVEDIQLNCQRFLNAGELSTFNLPSHIKLACTFGMDSTIKRCQDFVAGTGQFNKITQ
jgi:BTB/POZ domain